MTPHTDVSKNLAKTIRSLKIKKYRALHGLFLAEGRKIIHEIVKEGKTIRYLIVKKGFDWPKEWESNAEDIYVLEAKPFSEFSALSNNQEAIAVLDLPGKSKDIEFSNWVLALDGINDPGNLGTIIRCADWFGIEHLVCSEDTADLYNSKTLMATKGSFLRVNVVYNSLSKFLSGRPNGVRVLSAEMKGLDYRKELKSESRSGILVLGSEAHGISNEVQKLVDKSISIPRFGRAESLNVGVAAGILMAELRKS